MKTYFTLIFIFFGSQSSFSQQLSGEELLSRSIEYHDPQSLWDTFKSVFYVTMESQDGSLRKSKIEVDLNNSFFQLTVQMDDNLTTSTLSGEECILLFNGSSFFSEEIENEYRLTCNRAAMYRDYYQYLYGLPMKLNDNGTIIDPTVKNKKIGDTWYWRLRVTYEPEIGGDTWYFYFDQATYALKQYQFFHDESKNDGEYIVLDQELLVNGIKMPKNRSWFYNNDDRYLGIDLLSLD